MKLYGKNVCSETIMSADSLDILDNDLYYKNMLYYRYLYDKIDRKYPSKIT